MRTHLKAQSEPLDNNQLIALAKGHNLLADSLSKVLDPVQSLAVTDPQRIEALLVLTRISQIATEKISASSNQALQVLVKAADVLGEVSGKYWDNLNFNERLSVHSRLTAGFLDVVAGNDGTLSADDITKGAAQIKSRLSVKGVSGVLSV